MRYEGQAFEIEVSVPTEERGDRTAIGRRFHQLYHSIFGVSDAKAPVTFVNLRATVVGETAKVTRLSARAGRGDERPDETRAVFFDGVTHDAAVCQRVAIGPDRWIAGPAVVEQYDTTTFVPAGYRVRADGAGNLVGEAG